MCLDKPIYYYIYGFLLKLFLVLAGCFIIINCQIKQSKQFLSTENRVFISESAVNINTATVEELEKLPGIGRKIALEIIDHRERFGGFRKPEHLMLVGSIGDARFRKLRNLIKTE